MLTGSSVATAIEISSDDEDPADTCIKGIFLIVKWKLLRTYHHDRKEAGDKERVQPFMLSDTPSNQADPCRFANGKGKERAVN
ncbi:hypothetical protein M422DRAFT_32145 [Sphaerobolus stellatus SS14]|uniref:Uncharacterized protein n=1 Tax=Sphaerobolus stellatus (strain SS14) TaxID=990650 RepID=A0A0C9UC68_SPHS4|nr:hypothetical protein M422DRAFT_32145 [Sphaerobolus stellatus SS14]